jgi:hypothetical protein
MNLQKAEGMKPAGWAMREHKEQKNKIKGGVHPTPPGIEQEDWKKQLELNLKNLIEQGKASSPTNVPVETQPSSMPQVQQTVEQQASSPKVRRVKEKSKEPDNFQRILGHMASGQHDKADAVVTQIDAKQGLSEYQDAIKTAFDNNDTKEMKRLIAEHKSKYFPEKPKPVVPQKETKPYRQKQAKEETPWMYGFKNGRITKVPDLVAMMDAKSKELDAEDSKDKAVPEFPNENTGKPEPVVQKPVVQKPQIQMPENPEGTWKEFGKDVKATLAAFNGDVDGVRHFYKKVISKGRDRFMNHVIPPADTIDFLLDRASKE